MMNKTVKNGADILLEVEGMDCQSCAITIEKFLQKQGSANVSVNYASGDVSFKLGGQADLSRVITGIEKLGYKVVKNNHHTNHQRDQHSEAGFFTIERKLIICSILTIPLLLPMFIDVHQLHNPYVQLILSFPVYLIGVFHFGRNAWNALKNGVAHMDLLIIIGALAAFIYSFTGTIILNLGSDYMFYETGATIITLVLLGNFIEHKTVAATTSAIKELGKLQPAKAKLITYNSQGEEIKEIDFSEIRTGDFLKVNNGDRIPTDGEIISGDVSVNEAMITGESIPVLKTTGDKVIGGTIIVDGSMKMKTTAVGEETVLSQIIDLVKRAQSNKPSIQKFADQVSGYFVPAVLIISVLTFLISFFLFNISAQFSLLHSVAVLVISCPCAMGLATPTAVMVGIGRVSKNGILIKGGDTIETFAKIKTIVFDKTGTLTTGEFKISDVYANNFDVDELKSILASLETHSSHPLAKSVCRELKHSTYMLLQKVIEIKGLSIEGTDINGNIYKAGSYKIASHLTDDRSYNIYLLKNEKLIGAVAMVDEVKPEAQKVIQQLKEKGIRTILLSGDNQKNCARVAQETGIEEFYSEQSPQNKIDFIAKLSGQSATAMVGDGINDAPALAKSTVGISLSNASQIAIQSSQIILLNGDLNLLISALNITNKTLQTIRQNLFWALSYNLIAIPVAAFGFLNPMWGAAFMAFSDVVVIGNSLRLKTRKIN